MNTIPIVRTERSNCSPGLASDLARHVAEVIWERNFWLERIVVGLNRSLSNFVTDDDDKGDRIYFMEVDSYPYNRCFFGEDWWFFFVREDEEEKFSQFADKAKEEEWKNTGGELFMNRWHGFFQPGGCSPRLEIVYSSSFEKGEEVTKVVKEYFRTMGFEVSAVVNRG